MTTSDLGNMIGRDEALSLQVLNALVSRKHLWIWFDKATSKYYADDMQSKHGIFINMHKVTDDTVLADGDKVLIGNTTLLYTDEDFDSRDSALAHYKTRGERIYRTRGDSYIYALLRKERKKQEREILDERSLAMEKKQLVTNLWSKSDVALLWEVEISHG